VFFPYIRAFQWFNSNLWLISAQDLRQFPNLILLSLSKNKITTLESDVFKFTPRLILINFDNNLLFHVGDDFLETVRYLSKAYFRSNPCFNDYELTPSAVRRLNERIPEACPMLPEEVTSYPPPTTVSMIPTEDPEGCSSKCLDIITSLHDRLVLLENTVQQLVTPGNSSNVN
jgi:hypothetical protein